MARSRSLKVREVSKDEYIPWESGEGFISAFFKTTRDALSQPLGFSERSDPERDTCPL
jgi:hypothetical protein